MPENHADSMPSSEAPLIAGRTVGFYVRSAGIPVLFGSVLGAVTIIIEAPMEVLWAIYVVLFAAVGWHLVRNDNASAPQGMVLGAATGVLTGLIVAIIRLLTFRTFYYFFNLITDPILLGLLGAGVASLTVWVLHRDTALSTMTSTKGGGQCGKRKTS